MFRDNLKHIIGGHNLTQDQMAEMISEIFSGEITDAQIGAMMASLATKGETVDEIAGAARVLRSKALSVRAPVRVPMRGKLTIRLAGSARLTGTVKDGKTANRMIGWARKYGMQSTIHTGGPSIPGGPSLPVGSPRAPGAPNAPGGGGELENPFRRIFLEDGSLNEPYVRSRLEHLEGLIRDTAFVDQMEIILDQLRERLDSLNRDLESGKSKLMEMVAEEARTKNTHQNAANNRENLKRRLQRTDDLFGPFRASPTVDSGSFRDRDGRLPVVERAHRLCLNDVADTVEPEQVDSEGLGRRRVDIAEALDAVENGDERRAGGLSQGHQARGHESHHQDGRHR